MISSIDKTSATQITNTSFKYSKCFSKDLISKEEDFPPLINTKPTTKPLICKNKDTKYHKSMLFSSRLKANIRRKFVETSSKTHLKKNKQK